MVGKPLARLIKSIEEAETHQREEDARQRNEAATGRIESSLGDIRDRHVEVMETIQNIESSAAQIERKLNDLRARGSNGEQMNVDLAWVNRFCERIISHTSSGGKLSTADAAELNRLLIDYSGMGSDSAVDALLHAGADVRAKDADGNTALHVAAAIGHTDIAYRLARRGAEINGENNSGMSPLHYAALWGHPI